MIALIIRCYFIILLSVGIGSVFVFMLGIIWIFRRFNSPVMMHHKEDILAIAGDDVVATQLDLARAYIETDHKELAKDILEVIYAQGTLQQRNEAKQLLAQI
jgi:FimV-like protein